MGVKDETVGAFLEAVAAPTPTTGGGSVSALAGALGAALTRMVASLARDKKGYEAVQADLLLIETRGREIQARLVELVDEDSRAYGAVVAAMKLPRATDAERAARVEAMQTAYKDAACVPLETMEACSQVLDLAAQVIDKGHRGAVTDAAVAILLAEAGCRGASLNVRINLASIRDDGFRATAEAQVARILRHADEVGQRAMAQAEGRI